MIFDIAYKLCFKGRLLYLLTGMLFLCGISSAQSSIPINRKEKHLIRQADRLWNNVKWNKALDLYQKALSINPRNTYVNFQIGIIYFLSDSVKIRSLQYFQNAIKYAPSEDDNSIVDAYYYLGYCYMLENKYDTAALVFKKYESYMANTPSNAQGFAEIDRNIAECNQAPAILNRNPDSTAYLISGKLRHTYVKNLGSNINSEYPEYSQLLFNHDSTLVFVSCRPTSQKGKKNEITGEYFEDMYISKKDAQGHWSAPSLFNKELNISQRKLQMSTVTISADGNTLFIYQDEPVLESTKKDGKWTEPENITKYVKSLKQHFISTVFLSNDGKRLLIASDAKGGYGGHDIYECVKDSSGKWSAPENLGPVINTPQDEYSPYLMPDNSTLFFSSKGHGGLGGYDVFVSHYANGKWSAPENLGAPINSPDDDIYFTYNEKEEKGYFSSARERGGYGDMDIYSFSFKPDTTEERKKIQDSILTLAEKNRAATAANGGVAGAGNGVPGSNRGGVAGVSGNAGNNVAVSGSIAGGGVSGNAGNNVAVSGNIAGGVAGAGNGVPGNNQGGVAGVSGNAGGGNVSGNAGYIAGSNNLGAAGLINRGGVADSFNYSVITGCFRVKRHAENLISQYERKGIHLSIVGRNSIGLYMVGYGLYSTHDSAAVERTRFRKYYEKDAWIKAFPRVGREGVSSGIVSGGVNGGNVSRDTSAVYAGQARGITKVSYSIIAGCFRVKKHAENLISEFEKQNVHLSIISIDSQGFYMVGYGKFLSHDEAAAERAKFRKEYVKDAWIMAN